jgi:ABC-2 type transport system permease protein
LVDSPLSPDPKSSRTGYDGQGPVNWVGLQTLLIKEIARFMKVAIQTLLAPLSQTLLFMAVLSLAWGDARGDVLGVGFIAFLAPGLVMMSVLSNAFANSSSSLIVAKLQGNAADFLTPPLSALELTLAFVGGAAVRGVLVGIVSQIGVSFFAPTIPASPLLALYFLLVGSVMMGAAGVIAGLWAHKFDHLSAVTSFIVAPLTFLSGTFYSVHALPEPFSVISLANPFFHMIDGYRAGFIGVSDSSIGVAMVSSLFVTLIMCFIVYQLFRTGWRLKA